MATKLWDKGFEPDKMIEEYTVGNDRELDMRLARYDVQGSLAHIAMLETIGLLTAGELEKLTAGLKEIAAEIVRCPGAWEKVLVGLDFFDASINRVGAWATGTRAMEKSLLYALLQPGERLKELQDTYQFTEKMMLAEQAKSMPFGAVWDEYCRRAGCPLDGELYPAVAAYEAKILPERM